MKNYIVYLDMDGVLADFNAATDAIIDKNSPEFSKNKLWKAIDSYNYTVQPFFENLPLMPDSHVLIEFLEKNFNTIEILTASGFMPKNAGEQKIKWGAKYFPNYNVNVVKKSDQKAAYARHNTILIDDRDKCILPFRAAGGIGILHKSAVDTINEISVLLKL